MGIGDWVKKVLSIKQPYAELILTGEKKIEYRSWDTSFRGKFLIHASKKPEKNSGFDIELEGLDYGKIIGEVEIVHVFDYEENGFGWQLENPRRIKPIEINGKLSFWNYEGEIEYVVDR